MSSRLLFFCIVSLVVNTGFSLRCYGTKNGEDLDVHKDCPSDAKCCMKVTKNNDILDKRCHIDCGKEDTCAPYNKNTHGLLTRRGVDFTGSTICFCTGGMCNGENTSSFVAAILLTVLIM